ncbi:hypothetical protein PR048_021288 [Dryococelus australis]|uniref:Uncharacterized protein n=1 Tax=Dryococelus australis TaxID=614101 RepID=A0ABQ9GXT2_9NEOP|nr:hypothetical protein PR048_021288 [Dryococelus australis]
MRGVVAKWREEDIVGRGSRFFVTRICKTVSGVLNVTLLYRLFTADSDIRLLLEGTPLEYRVEKFRRHNEVLRSDEGEARRDPRENPPNCGVSRRDSRVRKSGRVPAGSGTRFALMEASTLAAESPRPLLLLRAREQQVRRKRSYLHGAGRRSCSRPARLCQGRPCLLLAAAAARRRTQSRSSLQESRTLQHGERQKAPNALMHSSALPTLSRLSTQLETLVCRRIAISVVARPLRSCPTLRQTSLNCRTSAKYLRERLTALRLRGGEEGIYSYVSSDPKSFAPSKMIIPENSCSSSLVVVSSEWGGGERRGRDTSQVGCQSFPGRRAMEKRKLSHFLKVNFTNVSPITPGGSWEGVRGDGWQGLVTPPLFNQYTSSGAMRARRVRRSQPATSVIYVFTVERCSDAGDTDRATICYPCKEACNSERNANIILLIPRRWRRASKSVFVARATLSTHVASVKALIGWSSSSRSISFKMSYRKVHLPGRVTTDCRMWELCRTLPLVGAFSRRSPVSPRPYIPAPLRRMLQSQRRVRNRFISPQPTPAATFKKGPQHLVQTVACFLNADADLVELAAHLLLRRHCVIRYNYNPIVNIKHSWGHGGVVVRLLSSHHVEPGSTPGKIAPGFLHVGSVQDDAAGRLIFSLNSHLPHPCIPVLLHTHLTLPSRTLKSFVLGASQISSLAH